MNKKTHALIAAGISTQVKWGYDVKKCTERIQGCIPHSLVYSHSKNYIKYKNNNGLSIQTFS